MSPRRFDVIVTLLLRHVPAERERERERERESERGGGGGGVSYSSTKKDFNCPRPPYFEKLCNVQAQMNFDCLV